MQNKTNLPLYVRMSILFIGILAFFYLLYIGRAIIVPFVFALIIAILLNPFVNFLKKKMNRMVAITIAIVTASLVMIGLILFIGTQATMFSDSVPQLRQKFIEFLSNMVQWASVTFNISTSQIQIWIQNAENEGLKNGPGVIGQTITTISGLLVITFLIPVYTFLFLYYKPLLLNFIAKLFPPGNYETLIDVLTETKQLIQNYLIGLMIEFVLLTSLYTLSLLLFGIQYALLLGVIGGLLNLIPYIGRIVAVALPMLLALATKEPVYALYIFGCYSISKFIDNNFINPVIVASKVKINALVSIVVVLIGGAIWGVAGMFLSLPLTAIAKVIFDRVDGLKALGFLLGDTMPPKGQDIFIFGKPPLK